MGRRFIFLEIANLETTKKVLSFTLHQMSWSTCMYQEWITKFNVDNLVDLKTPT